MCAVTTCGKPVYRRIWCNGHYDRWKKHGDVQAHIPLRARLDRRLQILAKIRPDPETGHWHWTGHINKTNGYGYVNIARKPTGAHRAVYELLVGPIPPGHEPDHVCRVRDCVNVYDPTHVEVVTQTENKRRARAATPPAEMCRNGLHPHVPGVRTCRECKNAGERAAYHRAKDNRAS